MGRHYYKHVNNITRYVNTWKMAALTKDEKQKHRKHDHPEEYLGHIQQDKLTTWTSPNGEQPRQIDYIAISHKYRNTVFRAWEVQGWRGNANQQRQHVVIRVDIALILMQKYRQPYRREAGKHNQYDIEQLKQQPEKLENGISEETMTKKRGETIQDKYNKKIVQQKV